MSGLIGFGSSPPSFGSSPRAQPEFDSSSSSSSVASPVIDSTSRALASVRSGLGLAPASEVVPGLVPTTTRTYVAPGGDYASLAFMHTFGCQNAMNSEIEDFVRRVVARSSSRTMKEVQSAAEAVLLSKGCQSGCGLDKDSTRGLFVRYVSDHGSVYTPSLLLSASAPSPPCDSQLVIRVCSFTPILPDGSFELPAGALSSKHGTPSPNNTPLFGPSSFAPAPVAVVIPSTTPSIPSALANLSSGHRKMYEKKGKHGFHQDRDSDEDYVPAAPEATPHRAHSLSPAKKAIHRQERRKRQAVPLFPDLSGPFGSFRFPAPSSVPATYTDPSPFSPVLPTPTPAPDTIASIPPSSPAADVPPSSEVARDTLMALGSDRNSEATGLGDSIHAVRAPSPSQTPSTALSERSISRLASDGTTITGLPNTQEELDMHYEDWQRVADAKLKEWDDVIAAGMAASIPASLHRDESILGSLLVGLDDIRSGNTIPNVPYDL